MNFFQKLGRLWVIKPLKASVTFHVKVNNQMIKQIKIRSPAVKM